MLDGRRHVLQNGVGYLPDVGDLVTERPERAPGGLGDFEGVEHGPAVDRLVLKLLKGLIDADQFPPIVGQANIAGTAQLFPEALDLGKPRFTGARFLFRHLFYAGMALLKQRSGDGKQREHHEQHDLGHGQTED